MNPRTTLDRNPRIVAFGPEITGLSGVISDTPVQERERLGDAEGVIVTFGADPTALARELASTPGIRWVQLPSAGIEAFAEALLARPDIVWTSAKGAYARPVAEHALMLTLALLRELPERISATTWGRASGASLHGLRVTVVGGGGVAQEIVRLLKAFDTDVTVIRRKSEPVGAADRTTTLARLDHVLPDTDVLILAAALTPSTKQMISEAQLRLLRSSSVLINIGRGPLIDTAALVRALEQGIIHGAALDVTDPEPLPDGHPLWLQPSCIITPHSADTMEMIVPLYLSRIRKNLLAYASGAPLEGTVDAVAGY